MSPVPSETLSMPSSSVAPTTSADTVRASARPKAPTGTGAAPVSYTCAPVSPHATTCCPSTCVNPETASLLNQCSGAPTENSQPSSYSPFRSR